MSRPAAIFTKEEIGRIVAYRSGVYEALTATGLSLTNEQIAFLRYIANAYHGTLNPNGSLELSSLLDQFSDSYHGDPNDRFLHQQLTSQDLRRYDDFLLYQKFPSLPSIATLGVFGCGRDQNGRFTFDEHNLRNATRQIDTAIRESKYGIFKYGSGAHWITVIVDPFKNLVRCFDSSGNSDIPDATTSHIEKYKNRNGSGRFTIQGTKYTGAQVGQNCGVHAEIVCDQAIKAIYAKLHEDSKNPNPNPNLPLSAEEMYILHSIEKIKDVMREFCAAEVDDKDGTTIKKYQRYSGNVIANNMHRATLERILNELQSINSQESQPVSDLVDGILRDNNYHASAENYYHDFSQKMNTNVVGIFNRLNTKRINYFTNASAESIPMRTATASDRNQNAIQIYDEKERDENRAQEIYQVRRRILNQEIFQDVLLSGMDEEENLRMQRDPANYYNDGDQKKTGDANLRNTTIADMSLNHQMPKFRNTSSSYFPFPDDFNRGVYDPALVGNTFIGRAPILDDKNCIVSAFSRLEVIDSQSRSNRRSVGSTQDTVLPQDWDHAAVRYNKVEGENGVFANTSNNEFSTFSFCFDARMLGYVDESGALGGTSAADKFLGEIGVRGTIQDSQINVSGAGGNIIRLNGLSAERLYQMSIRMMDVNNESKNKDGTQLLSSQDKRAQIIRILQADKKGDDDKEIQGIFGKGAKDPDSCQFKRFASDTSEETDAPSSPAFEVMVEIEMMKFTQNRDVFDNQLCQYLIDRGLATDGDRDSFISALDKIEFYEDCPGRDARWGCAVQEKKEGGFDVVGNNLHGKACKEAIKRIFTNFKNQNFTASCSFSGALLGKFVAVNPNDYAVGQQIINKVSDDHGRKRRNNSIPELQMDPKYTDRNISDILDGRQASTSSHSAPRASSSTFTGSNRNTSNSNQRRQQNSAPHIPTNTTSNNRHGGNNFSPIVPQIPQIQTGATESNTRYSSARVVPENFPSNNTQQDVVLYRSLFDRSEVTKRMDERDAIEAKSGSIVAVRGGEQSVYIDGVNNNTATHLVAIDRKFLNTELASNYTLESPRFKHLAFTDSAVLSDLVSKCKNGSFKECLFSEIDFGSLSEEQLDVISGCKFDRCEFLGCNFPIGFMWKNCRECNFGVLDKNPGSPGSCQSCAVEGVKIASIEWDKKSGNLNRLLADGAIDRKNVDAITQEKKTEIDLDLAVIYTESKNQNLSLALVKRKAGFEIDEKNRESESKKTSAIAIAEAEIIAADDLKRKLEEEFKKVVAEIKSTESDRKAKEAALLAIDPKAGQEAYANANRALELAIQNLSDANERRSEIKQKYDDIKKIVKSCDANLKIAKAIMGINASKDYDAERKDKKQKEEHDEKDVLTRFGAVDKKFSDLASLVENSKAELHQLIAEEKDSKTIADKKNELHGLEELHSKSLSDRQKAIKDLEKYYVVLGSATDTEQYLKGYSWSVGRQRVDENNNVVGDGKARIDINKIKKIPSNAPSDPTARRLLSKLEQASHSISAA